MTAGGELDAIGQAVGFIGNYIDPQKVAASAVRTSFLYTPFWLPVVIVFSASAFSADFATRSVAVTKARGGSPSQVVAAKAAVTFAAVGLTYALGCLSAFLFKASQYGVAVGGADMGPFLSALGANVVLLWALAAQTMLLFCLFKSSFASALGLLLLTAFVLVGYPSSYASTGEAPAANLLFTLSPAYYLVHTSSLSFDGVSLLACLAFGIAATAAALAGSMIATNVKEV